MSAFFYENRPRNLRIWDESYLPSEPVSISITDMIGLSGMLTYLANDLANRLAELGKSLTSDKVGQAFQIPVELAELGGIDIHRSQIMAAAR